MSERKISYNRGVHKRSVFENDDPIKGQAITDVYMYVDQPGVFYNAFEIEVSDDLARRAGYDVDVLRKHKLANERRADFEKALRAEMELGVDPGDAKVVQEREGFKLMDIGKDRFQILGPDGYLVNKSGPLPGKRAAALFNEVIPEKPKEPEA